MLNARVPTTGGGLGGQTPQRQAYSAGLSGAAPRMQASAPGLGGQAPQTQTSQAGVLPMWNSWMGQAPAQYAPFNTVAGFTPLQQQSWDEGLQGAQGMQDFANQLIDSGGFRDTSSSGGSSSSQSEQWSKPGEYTGPSMDFFDNPYLTGSIEGALGDATTSFNRNVMPGINTSFASQPGSTRQGIAQGLAAGDLSRNLGNIAMDTRMDSYNQGMQNYLNDMATQLSARTSGGTSSSRSSQSSSSSGFSGAAGNMISQGLMAPSQTMGGIGGQQQAMNQSQINAAKDRWDFGQNAAGNKLGQGIGMLGGTGAGSYQTGQSTGSSGKF